VIVLDLPLAVPSRNELDKMHWSKRHRLRADLQWLVRAAWTEQKIQIYCMDPGKVTIERYAPRMLDPSNMVGGCKQLVDALVSEGFFVNDTAAHLTETYMQHKSKRHHTVVRMEAA
jgi:hypothetical protein